MSVLQSWSPGLPGLSLPYAVKITESKSGLLSFIKDSGKKENVTPTVVWVLLDNTGIPGVGFLGCGEAQIPMVRECPNFDIFVVKDAVKWPSCRCIIVRHLFPNRNDLVKSQAVTSMKQRNAVYLLHKAAPLVSLKKSSEIWSIMIYKNQLKAEHEICVPWLLAFLGLVVFSMLF